MSAPRTPPPQEAADAQVSATAAVATLAPEAGPAATAMSTAETASRSLCHGEASSHRQPLIEVAALLLARLKPFLSESHIEVEARLGCLSVLQKSARENTLEGPAGATATTIRSDDAPRIVEGGCRHIRIGVSAEDFVRMKAYVEGKAKALPLQQTVTEDVNTQSGRYTYAIGEDGSESFIGCIEKRRLCNVEVLVPGCPYDIRVSLSTEVPKGVTDAPAVKPKGYVRRKRRWTATDETFEYAFTRVGADDDQRSVLEVEVEGVLANSRAGVTEAWLAELLSRLLALAQLKGNTGLPQRPLLGGHQRKRSR
ncbi:hypothetical protein JIQ42_04624 [Leishmania sp. Namibia]|uniref:hypothetical protein n=1 Tax=Leishmania sp. Namibia TaxID=2802991 RepID=UPI001B6609D9|nr:hypothetical protein JIQ42_04624 [Leishmania sp. Namibia]